MNVDKTCPANWHRSATSISYTISIQNTGNETLNITSVVDTVNAHSSGEHHGLVPGQQSQLEPR